MGFEVGLGRRGLGWFGLEGGGAWWVLKGGGMGGLTFSSCVCFWFVGVR